MNPSFKRRIPGFTLIEMMLVMVIIAIILYASIGYMQQRTQALRIDRTVVTMQQVLNAALAYYVVNGTWPANIGTLQTGKFLPNTGRITNPWGQDILATPAAGIGPSLFYVYTKIPASGTTNASGAVAGQIAGGLPLGYISANAGSPPTTASACGTGICTVVSAVNIPGQNLNNASAVNFAGLYNHGACVPVPTCPVAPNGTTMIPQIWVVPVQVGGYLSGAGTTAPSYPITSFAAYAVGGTDTTPPGCSSASTLNPPCTNHNGAVAAAYWRACMTVSTQIGSTILNDWGKSVAMVAFTRCAIQNEPTGSTLGIYGN